jgi:hypothetical protein
MKARMSTTIGSETHSIIFCHCSSVITERV